MVNISEATHQRISLTLCKSWYWLYCEKFRMTSGKIDNLGLVAHSKEGGYTALLILLLSLTGCLIAKIYSSELFYFRVSQSDPRLNVTQ
jgi:hypothetical protein